MTLIQRPNLLQVATCPFCGLYYKRDTINEHILQVHKMKPKGVLLACPKPGII